MVAGSTSGAESIAGRIERAPTQWSNASHNTYYHRTWRLNIGLDQSDSMAGDGCNDRRCMVCRIAAKIQTELGILDVPPR